MNRNIGSDCILIFLKVNQNDKKRPSNAIIRVFLAIFLLIGVFMVGVLINHISKLVGGNDEELQQQPKRGLLHEEELQQQPKRGLLHEEKML